MLRGLLHDRLSVRPPSAASLGLLAIACLLGALAPIDRADAAQVTVVSPNGSQQTVSLDALSGQEDVRDRSYALRSSSGEATQTVTGFSLGAIVTAAGADPYGFSHLEVQRPGGGAVLLSRHQALDAGAFAEGPPVVFAISTGTAFVRPSSGPRDLNAIDNFAAPQGITMVLRKDSPLRVRAEASTERTRPGVDVSFTAIVEGAGAGEQLEISWYFDDGRSATGAKASHRFAKRGSYDVVVGVTTPGDGAGVSAVVTVQVGAPLGGPDRKGGGRNRDANAPDHGAAEGGSDVPSTSPGPTPPSPGTEDSNTDEKEKTVEDPVRERPQGTQVEGMLLTSSQLTPPEPATATAARTGSLSEDGDGNGPSDLALGLLATLGLLGLGALIETRSLLR